MTKAAPPIQRAATSPARKLAPTETQPISAIERKQDASSPSSSAIVHGLSDIALGPPPATRSPNRTGLPDRLKAGIESLAGFRLDDVRVHRNSARPLQLGAHAFAQGREIHLGPGQERHLPHEVWHVVQQKQGRVPITGKVGGFDLNDHAGLEREADFMGARAAQGSAIAAAPDSPRAIPGAIAPLPLQAMAADPVVQRQLIPVQGTNYHVDTRDGGRRQFTPDPGNNGLTGDYTCHEGYRYHYDDATKQYRVLGGQADTYWDVANDREMQRQSVIGNGQELHQFESLNGAKHRYDPATQAYQPLPQRACWIDTRGQFVDQYNRVLTPDGRGVDKQYGVAQENRTFVVPYKPLGADFLPGLPNLHGGNIDPHETPEQALAREVQEETGNRYAVSANHGQLAQHQNPPDPNNRRLDPNRYTVNSIAVTAQANNNVPRHEMAGEFRFTASDFINHAASDDDVKSHLFGRFRQDRAGDPLHAQHLAALPQDGPLDWRNSHAMNALAAKIRHEAQEHRQGQDDARAGNVLPQAASAERVLGHGLYHQGAAAARSNTIDPLHPEPAYHLGKQDYLDGLAAARVNAGAQPHVAHTQAMDDYQEGIARARRNADAGNEFAAREAHGQYMNGHQRGRAGALPEHDNFAYLAGHGDGRQLDEVPLEKKRRTDI